MTLLPAHPAGPGHRPQHPPPVDAELLSRALEAAGRLANEATDVIVATAGRGAHGGVPAGAGLLEAELSVESPFDWITDTSAILERHVRRVLTAEFPGIPVTGREFGPCGVADATSSPMGGPLSMDLSAAGPPGTAERAAGLHWVVDPVDGLGNHLAGMPWCAFSLALLDASGPVVGVVADPYRGQLYAAARGRGARTNGRPIRQAARTGIAGAIVCTEFADGAPWSGLGGFGLRLAAAGAGLRVLGSATLAVVQVALGSARAAVLPGHREREVAAALVLAAEAGAVVLSRQDGAGAELPVDGLLVAAPGCGEAVLHAWHLAHAGLTQPDYA